MKFDNSISPYLFKSVKNNTLQVFKKESKYLFDDIENAVNNLIEDEPLDLVTLEEEKNKFVTPIFVRVGAH